MELKTCEYCGTSYDASLSQCPLCGKAAEPAPAEPVILTSEGTGAPRKRQKGGKRLAKNQKKQQPAAAGFRPIECVGDGDGKVYQNHQRVEDIVGAADEIIRCSDVDDGTDALPQRLNRSDIGHGCLQTGLF